MFWIHAILHLILCIGKNMIKVILQTVLCLRLPPRHKQMLRMFYQACRLETAWLALFLAQLRFVGFARLTLASMQAITLGPQLELGLDLWAACDCHLLGSGGSVENIQHQEWLWLHRVGKPRTKRVSMTPNNLFILVKVWLRMPT